MKVKFILYGEPASKANSRELVSFGKPPPWRDLLQVMVESPVIDRATVNGWILRAKELIATDSKSRPALIKSAKARDYEAEAQRQIPPSARLMMTCPVRVTIRIYYCSQRPDLDESVVLDVLQAKYQSAAKSATPERQLLRRGVYVNDRQVREKHIFHGIDPKNPRAEIEVEPLEAQLFEDLAPPTARPPKPRFGGPAIQQGENPF